MDQIRVYLKDPYGGILIEFVEADSIEMAIEKGNKLYDHRTVYRVDYKGKKWVEGETLIHRMIDMNSTNVLKTPRVKKPVKKPVETPSVKLEVDKEDGSYKAVKSDPQPKPINRPKRKGGK